MRVAAVIRHVKWRGGIRRVDPDPGVTSSEIVSSCRSIPEGNDYSCVMDTREKWKGDRVYGHAGQYRRETRNSAHFNFVNVYVQSGAPLPAAVSTLWTPSPFQVNQVPYNSTGRTIGSPSRHP